MLYFVHSVGVSFYQIKAQTNSSVVNLVQYFVVFLSVFQQLAIKETKIKGKTITKETNTAIQELNVI